MSTCFSSRRSATATASSASATRASARAASTTRAPLASDLAGEHVLVRLRGVELGARGADVLHARARLQQREVGLGRFELVAADVALRLVERIVERGDALPCVHLRTGGGVERRDAAADLEREVGLLELDHALVALVKRVL